mmetsp:Transcript_15637/g.33971  ORF Transcript_15637/g.33971 Transcript_15637/m.33971 type:complete len:230 (-) Transcript_15637:230-919(-)
MNQRFQKKIGLKGRLPMMMEMMMMMMMMNDLMMETRLESRLCKLVDTEPLRKGGLGLGGQAAVVHSPQVLCLEVGLEPLQEGGHLLVDGRKRRRVSPAHKRPADEVERLDDGLGLGLHEDDEAVEGVGLLHVVADLGESGAERLDKVAQVLRDHVGGGEGEAADGDGGVVRERLGGVVLELQDGHEGREHRRHKILHLRLHTHGNLPDGPRGVVAYADVVGLEAHGQQG